MKKSEKILILGFGGMGGYLAKRLAHEGHHVTVIESDAKKIWKADSEIDARLIHGNGMSFSCWKEAGAASMDYLIAATDDDAVNIMAATIGEKFGIRQKIARVRSVELWSPEAVLTAQDLKIDFVIRPEELAAQEIVRLLKMRAGNVRVDVGSGELQVVATPIARKSPLAQITVKDLSMKYDEIPFRIVCVARDIDTIIPTGDFKILPDDRLYICARSEHIPQIMELAQISEERRHHVLIIGGGMIGARVAELLEKQYSVRLIDANEERAEELAHRLRKTECLHGDGSERQTLLEAGLLHMDTIVAATGDNETNIMTSVLAKHLLQTRADEHHAEIGKTIALVKREEYLTLASAMGTDLAVNKEILAANNILRYIRRGHVLSLSHLHGCDAEVVELLADPGSAITKKPLHAIDALKNRITIAAVRRKTGWEVAIGPTQIVAGDKVVCVCTASNLGDLQGLFIS